MELREIGNNVFACLQEDRGLGTSNSGLVNRAGGLVVDTFWDLPHTREMIGLYAKVCPTMARRVVNTHHNGDHCWGNQLFDGAEIIGHRRCAEDFFHENPLAMQALRGAVNSENRAVAMLARELQMWDFDGIELRPPTTTFEDRLDLDLEGTPVELLYVGPAHTGADTVVHLPKQRVVFTGDVLFRLCTPLGWEGTFDKWIAALDRIVELDPVVIVPGHGPLCGLEGPREMKAYLEYVRAEARRGFDDGLTTLETAKRVDLGPYAGWTQPERIVSHIQRAYREFQGESAPPADNTALFREMFELARERGALGGKESA